MFDRTKLLNIGGGRLPRTWQYFTNDDITGADYFPEDCRIQKGDNLTKISFNSENETYAASQYYFEETEDGDLIAVSTGIDISFANIGGSIYDNTSAATALNAKLSTTNTPNRIYGTNSTGEQALYLAGENIELSSDGKINVVGVQQQMFEMPEATADLLGSIVQYLGDDTETYTHGVMYQCVPVYGSFTVTTVGINNVTLDEETFKESFLYDSSISSYTFECTRGGLRQTWLLPNSQSWTGSLMAFGIEYMGRPTVGATITLSRSVVGYTWEAYAGVTAGNDKIKIVGEKISGINVVGQYNATTLPTARAELSGKIIQFNGQASLLSLYQDGHFYRCEEDRNMRNYTLEADPMKYSTLVVDNWFALEDFMTMYDNPVTFIWQGDGRGWVEEDSMSMLGSEDLTQYGITYTLESGQTLEVGDKITINFTTSYTWRLISVQDGIETVQFLPEPSEEYLDKIVLYDGWDSSLPEPDALYVQGKLYKCVEIYNEQTEEFSYEWQALPYQFSLLQYNELPSDVSKVYTDQCIQYVGLSQLWDIYAEDVYLENGHIYRATIVDEEYPDFAEVRYVDTHPYQMMYMPDPIEAYDGVITQYVGESGDYINGHFYKCVPTGQMTGPSSKYKIDGNFDVTINAETLATQTTDPNQTQVFEFQSQGEGYDWVLKVNDTTWTTVVLADYGITVLGSVPYGTQLKVKYQGPQPEYEWWDVQVADYVEQFYYMPDPIDDYTKEYMGRTVQYIGYEEDYIHNYFYQCMATSDPLSEGSVTMTVTDDEKFSEVIKRLSTGAITYSVKFHQDGSVYNPYWVLDALDSDGNVIGGQSFTNDATTFEAETGIKIEGTVDNLTEIIADIEVYWQQVDVQPIRDLFQVTTLPTAGSENLNRIVQYVGLQSQDLKSGMFYKCVLNAEYEGTISFNPQKIGFNYSDYVLADLFEHFNIQGYENVTQGTMTYRAAGDLWVMEGRDSSDTSVFTDFRLYTGDLESYGLVFIYPIQDYADGEVISFTINWTGRMVYTWENIRVQPEPDYTAITGFDSTAKQMLVHDANSTDLKWETISS